MKYGIKYIPHVGRLNTFNKTLYKTIKETNLAPVSRIEMRFDPFSPNGAAHSLRTYAFHVDTENVRRTNYKTSMKLSLVNDRSEPTMKVTFNNGEKAIFKTSNLDAIDIGIELNKICGQLEKATQGSLKK